MTCFDSLRRSSQYGVGIWVWVFFAVLGRVSAEPTRATRMWALNSAGHGAYSMVLDDEGRFWAWGSNRGGQFGDGTLDSSLNARRLPLPAGVAGWRQASLGAGFAALDLEGRLFGWGPTEGVLFASGGVGLSEAPVLLDAGPWLAVATPRTRFETSEIPWGLGIRTDGTLYWLRAIPGPGAGADRVRSIRVDGVEGVNGAGRFVEVAAGARFFLARSESGRVFTAGVGLDGLPGAPGTEAGKFQQRFVEVKLPRAERVWTRLAAADTQAFGWDDAGELYAWGRHYDAVGEWKVAEQPRLVPRPPGQEAWVAVDGGGDSEPTTVLVSAKGALWTAGPGAPGWIDRYGRGFDLYTGRALMHAPAEWGAVESVAFGPLHLLVLGKDGKVRAVGSNDDLQLGGFPEGDLFQFNSVTPGGTAPFLLGRAADTPVLELRVGASDVVEPTLPDGSDGRSPELGLDRRERLDLGVTGRLRIGVRREDGVGVSEAEAAELVGRLLQIPGRDGVRWSVALGASQVSTPIQISPRYALYTGVGFLFDVELLPDLRYTIGGMGKATLRYRPTQPSNYPVEIQVVWPMAKAVLFTGPRLEVVADLKDPDGHATTVTMQLNGLFRGIVRQSQTLPAVAPGVRQRVRFVVDASGPPVEGLSLSLTAVDNRGLRSAYQSGQAWSLSRSAPAVEVRTGGRVLSLVPAGFLDRLVLEASADLQTWTPVREYSEEAMAPGTRLEHDDGDKAEARRFYRLTTGPKN